MSSRVTSFLVLAIFTIFLIVISIASATDSSENPALRSEDEKNVTVDADPQCTQLSGDLDGNGQVILSDYLALVDYVINGEVPANPTAGDVDGDCDIDEDDIAYLEAYFFEFPPGPAPVPCVCDDPQLVTSSCCLGSIRGNANYDLEDKANVSDVSYLVAWLFGIPTGPAPFCIAEANANGDVEEKANVSDISYLVAWLFGIPSGPPPPACP